MKKLFVALPVVVLVTAVSVGLVASVGLPRRSVPVAHFPPAPPVTAPTGPPLTPVDQAAAPVGVSVTEIGARGATLIIPSIKVNAPIVPTGSVGPVGNSSLTIPDDIATVGWWNGQVTSNPGTKAQWVTDENVPAPGQPGVAVISGHIDSAVAGPGALYHLGEVPVGAAISVVGSDGAISMWRVSEAPVRVLKSRLPPSLGTNTGPPRLAIITCGGAFNPATGHYVDNIIVWAVPAA